MDQRIAAFQTAFHTEKYGPANKCESFAAQLAEETALLKQVYWVQESSFLGNSVKRSFVSAVLMYASVQRFSATFNERIVGVLDDLLHTATR